MPIARQVTLASWAPPRRYHRARISTLDAFDLVLGGLAWGITASLHDVDIEFLDEWSLGEKIKTAEQVVFSLRRMACPTALQAHQIQGARGGRVPDGLPAFAPVLFSAVRSS